LRIKEQETSLTLQENDDDDDDDDDDEMSFFKFLHPVAPFVSLANKLIR